MIETYLDANFDGDEQSWATSLVERIQVLPITLLIRKLGLHSM